MRLAAFRLVEAGLENKPGIESESGTNPIIICLSSFFFFFTSTHPRTSTCEQNRDNIVRCVQVQ